MKNYDQTPFRSMTAEQRVNYIGRFERWYANRQQITDCAETGALDDNAHRAFYEGVALLQAWPYGIKFLDSVECLPEVNCVSRMMFLTDLAMKSLAQEQPATPVKTATEHTEPSPKNEDQHKPALKREAQTKAAEHTPVVPAGKSLHIDQIAYLLSPALRAKAENIRTLLDARDVNSNEAKRMALEGKSDKEIAPYSEAAVKAQEEATDIFGRIDYELAVVCARAMKAERAGTAEEKDRMSALAEPFGSIGRMIKALTPYYEKCEYKDEVYANVNVNDDVTDNGNDNADCGGKPSAEYNQKDYKRIWTYVSRTDVAHTEKRMKKMRECIDEAKAAGMPNIEAMETFYAKEVEMVLAERQKKLNSAEPTLL